MTSIVGSADKTYRYFERRKALHQFEDKTPTPACVLDGDMEGKVDRNGNVMYPNQDGLFFHYYNVAPEKMLLGLYLAINPNANLQYHYDNSDPHCLMEKMVDEGLAIDKTRAFELCFTAYRNDVGGGAHFESLKQFLLRIVQ